MEDLIINADDNTITYGDGLENRLFNVVMDKINMSPVYLPPPPNNDMWGTLVNGSWTGIIGHIVERKSDVAFGSIMNDNHQFSESVDVTVPYTAGGYRWYVPCVRPVPGWLSLTRVFYPSVWLAFILVFVVVSVLVCYLVETSGSRRTSSYSSVSVCLLNLWAVILGVSAPNAVPPW